MTKAEEVAKIWADWNDEKISADTAIYEVKKLFPRATRKEWLKRHPINVDDEMKK